ncbi:hypothetical protein QO010_000202 [Caulobacter ginsengisoli]|uniref:DUF1993 domain-containing protein n=1 Tax=Caulobacter ginsengisoli TaxID=400775 RepID=A0ABU0IKH7_9CAUL|nr:DUF1993 domain-containing protein [Caulobacter ginsengisoli]MDQ0462454.1 hypothetical protein [Caulobacter ginsengisoli]
MGTSLYDLSVGNYLQTLTAVSGFLGRGLSHCQDNGIDPAEIVETRLHGDMLPFRFQIVSVCHHSLNALKGVQAGEFGPPGAVGELDYVALQKLVADTIESLKALKADDINALAGKDVTFALGTFKLPFTAENFILSFSLPNFHFHATTAYDILRSKGVPLGKRDYLGPLRLKM